MATKILHFRGADFPSVEELCKTYGISRSLMYYYNEGEPILDTIEWYLSNHGDFRKLKYNIEYGYCRDGKRYASFTAYCEEINVSIGHVAKLTKKRNISREEAVDMIVAGRKDHIFDYHGDIYPSFYNFCKVNNINRNYMYIKSKNDGTDLVKTVDNYLEGRSKRGGKFTFWDVEYRSRTACLQYFNIDFSTYRKYRKVFNTDEETITFCIKRQSDHNNRESKNYEYGGKWYHSFTDCIRNLGISDYRVIKRMNDYNISREEAITMCLKENEEKKNASNNTVR
jgi:hypothetical protein